MTDRAKIAIPMTLGVYNAYLNRETADEDPNAEGFMLEDLDLEPNHPDHQGLLYWMSTEAFEEQHGSSSKEG